MNLMQWKWNSSSLRSYPCFLWGFPCWLISPEQPCVPARVLQYVYKGVVPLQHWNLSHFCYAVIITPWHLFIFPMPSPCSLFVVHHQYASTIPPWNPALVTHPWKSLFKSSAKFKAFLKNLLCDKFHFAPSEQTLFPKLNVSFSVA